MWLHDQQGALCEVRRGPKVAVRTRILKLDDVRDSLPARSLGYGFRELGDESSFALSVGNKCGLRRE